ncbi:unannotated protein [freshwater metagenome]|uniref:Unannotated protein n=1 Tax=freshwater metagenome TaxID=449393 RepID=A0A6J6MNE1_9ZZZZ
MELSLEVPRLHLTLIRHLRTFQSRSVLQRTMQQVQRGVTGSMAGSHRSRCTQARCPHRESRLTGRRRAMRLVPLRSRPQLLVISRFVLIGPPPHRMAARQLSVIGLKPQPMVQRLRRLGRQSWQTRGRRQPPSLSRDSQLRHSSPTARLTGSVSLRLLPLEREQRAPRLPRLRLASLVLPLRLQ